MGTGKDGLLLPRNTEQSEQAGVTQEGQHAKQTARRPKLGKKMPSTRSKRCSTQQSPRNMLKPAGVISFGPNRKIGCPATSVLTASCS